uniref:Uncharacterized protein n=1 Tax=Sinocyclocheilus grahami TaxID=75366 RepID=A0A672Q5L2_SINGR
RNRKQSKIKWKAVGVFSCRLWQHVTRAIMDKDQMRATQEKFVLEEAQRQEVRERAERLWNPRLFTFNSDTNEWHYRYPEYGHNSTLIHYHTQVLQKYNVL